MSEKWDSSSYRKRNAERREKTTPEWVANPETGERFLLRRVSAIAYAISGAMPHNLTNDAVKSWKDQGVEIGDTEASAMPTARQIEEGNRNVVLMARVVQEACVIPRIVPGATGDEELDPIELDDRDLIFIFKWATGQVGNVQLQGGQAMNVADLKSVSKRSGKRSRTGTDG